MKRIVMLVSPWLITVAAAADAGAQQAVPLTHRSTFPEAFGFLQSVREMPDGRVMAADPLGRTLALLDLALGTAAPVGREGQGPGEWRQPDAVFPLPGDSTLLVDLGNARLSVIAPDGRFVATHPMMLGQPGPGAGPFDIVQPRGVDREGRVYFQAMSRRGGPGAAADSAAVKRWSRVEGEAPARIAGLRPPAMSSASSGQGGGGMQVRMQPVPLAQQDDWAVAPDGRVAVVRAEPYRVEWHSPAGGITRGPEVSVPRTRVRDAEKERWLDEVAGTGMGVSVQMGPGGPNMSFRRGGAGGRPEDPGAAAYEWPETLPAFRPGRSMVAPDGRLWVERYSAVGSPVVYDVFDQAGVRTARYRLPAGQRIIGMTERAVYAVRTDELGLNWLEVYEPAADPKGAPPSARR